MARKRTNKNVPAKGRLREMADQLWSLSIKEDWGHKCAICGKIGDLNSHHLIPRQHYATRYELRNGICLCRRCHQFCPDRSPHQNAMGFLLWLEEHQSGVAGWYSVTTETGAFREFNETKNAVYYIDVLRSLQEYVEQDEFVEVVGKRFSQWLEENE